MKNPRITNHCSFERKQINKTTDLKEIEQLKKQNIKEKEVEQETVNIQNKGLNNRIKELKKKDLL